MTDPTDVVTGVTLQKITEATASVSDAGVSNIDTVGAEKIEMMNKGPNSVYFRLDGTTPTAGAAGNGEALASGGRIVLERGNIEDVKAICDTGETATLFSRLYS